jgi:DNA-binding protein YbaB
VRTCQPAALAGTGHPRLVRPLRRDAGAMVSYYEPAALAREVREAYAPPVGPFVGVLRSVEVEVAADGALVGVVFVPAWYRATADHDLCEAIVAAHARARDEASAAEREMLPAGAAETSVIRRLREFAGRIAAERIQVDAEDGLLGVVIGGDGALLGIKMAGPLRRRCDRARVAARVADVIRTAERAAAECRTELVAGWLR